MISLDVISLFTNIAADRTNTIIIKKRWHKILAHTSVSEAGFIDLLKFGEDKNYVKSLQSPTPFFKRNVDDCITVIPIERENEILEVLPTFIIQQNNYSKIILAYHF